MSGNRGRGNSRNNRNPSNPRSQSGAPRSNQSNSADPTNRSQNESRNDHRNDRQFNPQGQGNGRTYHNPQTSYGPPPFQAPNSYQYSPSGYHQPMGPPNYGPPQAPGYIPSMNPQYGAPLTSFSYPFNPQIPQAPQGIQSFPRWFPRPGDPHQGVHNWLDQTYAPSQYSTPPPPPSFSGEPQNSRGRGRGRGHGRGGNRGGGQTSRIYGNKRQHSPTSSTYQEDERQGKRLRTTEIKTEDESRLIKPSNVEAVKAAWCLKCHSPKHSMTDCKDPKNPEIFKQSTFGLEDVVCSYADFQNIQFDKTNEVGWLIHHIFYAVRRLNCYVFFAAKRDELLVAVNKRASSRDHAVDPQQYPLAWLEGRTPFEVFASRANRLTHYFVHDCGEALKRLYKDCVAKVVDWKRLEDDLQVNSKVPFTEICGRIATKIKAAQAERKAKGEQQTLAPDMGQCEARYLEVYLNMIRKAQDKYQDAMNDLQAKWVDLIKAHEMWKTPLSDGNVVLNELPFHQFRLKLEMPTSPRPEGTIIAIPTVKAFKLKTLKEYISEKVMDIQLQEADVDVLDAEADKAQSVPPTSEPETIADMKAQMHRMVEQTRMLLEHYRANLPPAQRQTFEAQTSVSPNTTQGTDPIQASVKENGQANFGEHSGPDLPKEPGPTSNKPSGPSNPEGTSIKTENPSTTPPPSKPKTEGSVSDDVHIPVNDRLPHSTAVKMEVIDDVMQQGEDISMIAEDPESKDVKREYID